VPCCCHIHSERVFIQQMFGLLDTNIPYITDKKYKIEKIYYFFIINTTNKC
jgi:hypothetical protein